MRTAAAVLLALILALPVFAASRADEPRPSLAFSAVAAAPDVSAYPSGLSGRTDPSCPLAIERRSGREPVGECSLVDGAAGVPDVWKPSVAGAPGPVERPQPSIPPPRLIVVSRGSPQPPSHRASGTASYCAPTPRYCHGWGGDAHLAAVESFRYGDARYTVRVCGTKGCTTVTVVSYGVLPKGRIIDLSPAAFEEACGPLWMGVCRVKVTGLR